MANLNLGQLAHGKRCLVLMDSMGVRLGLLANAMGSTVRSTARAFPDQRIIEV